MDSNITNEINDEIKRMKNNFKICVPNKLIDLVRSNIKQDIKNYTSTELNEFDFLVYLGLRTQETACHYAERVYEVLPVTCDDYITQLNLKYFGIQELNDLLFGLNKKNEKRNRNEIWNSVCKLINLNLIYCFTHDMKYITLSEFESLYKLRKGSNNELYFIFCSEKDISYCAIYTNQLLELLQVLKKANLKMLNHGFIVIFYATIMQSFIWSRKLNGRYQNCLLPKEKLEIFRQRDWLYRKSNQIFNDVGIHKVTCRYMIGAQIFNAVFYGNSSLNELQDFAVQKTKKIKSKYMEKESDEIIIDIDQYDCSTPDTNNKERIEHIELKESTGQVDDIINKEIKDINLNLQSKGKRPLDPYEESVRREMIRQKYLNNA